MELWVFVFQSPLYSHLKTQHVVTCCERLHTSANIAQQETTMLRVVASVCTGLNLFITDTPVMTVFIQHDFMFLP